MSEVDLLSPLKGADVVTMPKEEALEKFNEYRNALGRAQNAADKLIMQCYRALSKGHGVLNVAEAMKKAGVHGATGLPRLAIMRADYEFVYFERHGGGGGGGFFSFSERFYLSRRVRKAQVTRQQFHFGGDVIPPAPPEASFEHRWQAWRAPLPHIPPQFRPADALSKYCLLWEVAADGWTRVERPVPPADPMLLRPLGTTGLYVVLAHWDLTPVERMVLGGLLGQ